MLAEFESWHGQASSPLPEALNAMNLARPRQGKPSLLLAYGPVARMNAYQSLLYKEFPRRGAAILPLNKMATVSSVADLDLGPSAIHLHWINVVTAGARTEWSARARVDDFCAMLDGQRARRVKLVWTVHNLLPHDVRFPAVEHLLRQRVADSCDLVHIMTRSTPEAVSRWLSLDPDRIIYAPHPSYIGAFPDHVSKEEARFALGIGPDEDVAVLFGAIKPYKGLSNLLSAFESIHHDSGRRIRLIIAGQPDSTPDTERFVAWGVAHPWVVVYPKKVPAELVQYFLRAADVGVAPYARVLNSGAAALYSSFGLPTVAPDEPSMREALPEGSILYSDPDELGAVLLRSLKEVTPSVNEQVLEFSRTRLAHAVSAGFADEMIGRLAS